MEKTTEEEPQILLKNLAKVTSLTPKSTRVWGRLSIVSLKVKN